MSARFSARFNRRLDARGCDYRVDVDGEFGPDTMDTGQIVAYVLGVGTDKQDDLLSKQEQEVIRDPEKRNETQLKRAAQRRKLLDDLLEPHGGAEAVIKVRPALRGAHREPRWVELWPGDHQRLSEVGAQLHGLLLVRRVRRLLRAQGRRLHVLQEEHRLHASHRRRRQGASQRVHRLVLGQPSSAWRLRPLQLAGGEFVDHVEIVIKDLGGGRLECIGGNTSQGKLHNNGGGIYRQVRQSGLAGVARPRYR